jgi:hypothetical protein
MFFWGINHIFFFNKSDEQVLRARNRVIKRVEELDRNILSWWMLQYFIIEANGKTRENSINISSFRLWYKNFNRHCRQFRKWRHDFKCSMSHIAELHIVGRHYLFARKTSFIYTSPIVGGMFVEQQFVSHFNLNNKSEDAYEVSSWEITCQ